MANIIFLKQHTLELYQVTRSMETELVLSLPIIADEWKTAASEIVATLSSKRVSLLLADECAYVVRLATQSSKFRSDELHAHAVEALEKVVPEEFVAEECFVHSLDLEEKNEIEHYGFVPVLTPFRFVAAALFDAGVHIDRVSVTSIAKKLHSDPLVAAATQSSFSLTGKGLLLWLVALGGFALALGVGVSLFRSV